MSILDDFDRLKKAFAGFVLSVMNRVKYNALYPCTVASQNGDGTLELTPDLKSVLGPGLSSVKYKPGIPGATVTVQAGTRVLLGFENGDPSKPYAEGWDQIGTVTQTAIAAGTILLSGGGTAATPVAKEGSGTAGHQHTFALTAGPWPVAGTIGNVLTGNTDMDKIAVGQGSQNVKVP